MFVAPYGGSGAPDLYGVKLRRTGSGRVEVHVLSAESGYRAFSAHIATAQPVLADSMLADVALASRTAGGAQDLYLVPLTATGSGSVEVHALSGAGGYSGFLGHWATALPTSTVRPGEWSFLVADGDRNGDLMGVWHAGGTGSGRTEVHTLAGADGYRSFNRHVATPLGLASRDAFTFALGEQDGDSAHDLFVLARLGTGTASTEVHVLSGRSNLTSWTLHTGTALQETGPAWQLDVG